MASHPSTSCATRPSPPVPASTRQAEVAFQAAGPLEKAPAGTDGRSRSSAVCGSASSQCKPPIGSAPIMSTITLGSIVLSLRAIERVSEVGRNRKLVSRHFQFWVGAARVQKPQSTLHADWKDVLFIDVWDSPPCACCQNSHKNILRKFVPNDCSVCRFCFCFDARPPADCSMASFQNLELFSVEMFSPCTGIPMLQRKDAVPVAAVSVAALQPCELIVGDVGLLVQRSCRDFVRSYCIANDLPTLSRSIVPREVCLLVRSSPSPRQALQNHGKHCCYELGCTNTIPG